jgi:hypothetical protein
MVLPVRPTYRHTNQFVLAEGPEIAIRPITARRAPCDDARQAPSSAPRPCKLHADHADLQYQRLGASSAQNRHDLE